MKLTLTAREAALICKLAQDRLSDIVGEVLIENDKANDNQQRFIAKLCKKLKRQIRYDKDKRRRKTSNQGKAGGDKGTAPDGIHPAQSAGGRTDTGEQRIEYKA